MACRWQFRAQQLSLRNLFNAAEKNWKLTRFSRIANLYLAGVEARWDHTPPLLSPAFKRDRQCALLTALVKALRAIAC